MKKHALLSWTVNMQQGQNVALNDYRCSLFLSKSQQTVYAYTDLSDFQMGACIVQDSLLISYYSKKLNSAQKYYATTEKEMLSTTLEDFCSMLLGSNICLH